MKVIFSILAISFVLSQTAFAEPVTVSETGNCDQFGKQPESIINATKLDLGEKAKSKCLLGTGKPCGVVNYDVSFQYVDQYQFERSCTISATAAPVDVSASK